MLVTWIVLRKVKVFSAVHVWCFWRRPFIISEVETWVMFQSQDSWFINCFCFHYTDFSTFSWASESFEILWFFLSISNISTHLDGNELAREWLNVFTLIICEHHFRFSVFFKEISQRNICKNLIKILPQPTFPMTNPSAAVEQTHIFQPKHIRMEWQWLENI